jgi:hypothetical protein
MRFSSLIALSILFGANVSGQTLEKSVLSEGNWYKIGVVKTGMHTLTYADLTSAGIDVSEINPRNLALFGNGGGMLPQQNSYPRPRDLRQNGIIVSGEEDGHFDANDKIIFYGEGPHIWNYDDATGTFNYSLHLYTDTNFYFLRTDFPDQGKRIQEAAELPEGNIAHSFPERIHYEKEINNFIHSGRFWYGDLIESATSKTFTFPVTDLASDSVEIEISLVGRSYANSSCKVYAGETMIDEIVFDTYGSFYFSPVADFDTRRYKVHKSLVKDGQLLITLESDRKGAAADAYISFSVDYIDVFYQKTLHLNNSQVLFRSFNQPEGGAVTFKYPSADGEAVIAEIGEDGQLAKCKLKSEGEYFTFTSEGKKEFVAFKGDNHYSPVSLKKIGNQNLHGSQEIPHLIIVTHPDFLTQAQKLADHRRSADNLNVLVATTEQVYNEFSSGKQDVSAIRDLAKYYFDLNNGKDSLKYLLLLGEGSFNYKTLDPAGRTFVPVYQSRESTHPLRSFASDDFYAFMEDYEGYWDENSSGNSSMDIGVGRLPVRDVTEAENVVRKIIGYGTESARGNWSNKVTFIADDNDANLHLNDSEKHINVVDKKYPQLQYQKVYLDYFEQLPASLPGGERSRQFTDELKRVIDNGTLFVNFVGHGGPPSLGNERLLEKETVDKWDNKILPLFVTATCKFALVDQPELFSLGRYMVLKEHGGGIGIISGTRAAYSSANFSLNSALMRFAFDPYNRMGDVMRLTKNSSFSDVYNRHFTYIGDPSLRLDLPLYTAQINSVTKNGEVISDTLNALSRITISGDITDREGNPLSDFNGTATIELLDKEDYEVTRGKANAEENPGPPKTYKVRKNVISKITTTVVNGSFETILVLPLSFSDDSVAAAKFVVHAYSTDGNRQAAGATLRYFTGGVDSNAVADNKGPEIFVYLDDETFTDGDTTSPDPTLLANLYDENGINQSTKNSDHLIISVLNNDSTLVMNNFYNTTSEDFRNGKVKFRFTDLPQGGYVLNLQASDTYHNRSSRQIRFYVIDTYTSVVLPFEDFASEYLAYPNPFREEVSLTDIKSKSALGGLEIYNMAGVLIRTVSVNEGAQEVKWDGTDAHGVKVDKGVYICRVINFKGNKGKSVLVIMQ